MEKDRKIEVKVNFAENKLTIVETSVEEIFVYPPNQTSLKKTGYFRIEGDHGGFSRLEFFRGQILLRNYLRKGLNDYKLTDEKRLGQIEAREYIRGIVKQRIENR